MTDKQITTADYVEVPTGYYMCFINGCDRVESKSGKPMLKVTLKIATACDEKNKEFEGRYLWVYQITNTMIGQNLANEWENIAQHFPTTPIKVSKYEREGKNGITYVNYKPWLTDAQNAQLSA